MSHHVTYPMQKLAWVPSQKKKKKKKPSLGLLARLPQNIQIMLT